MDVCYQPQGQDHSSPTDWPLQLDRGHAGEAKDQDGEGSAAESSEAWTGPGWL